MNNNDKLCLSSCYIFFISSLYFSNMNYDYDFSSLINNLKFSKQKNIHHPPSLPHKINK